MFATAFVTSVLLHCCTTSAKMAFRVLHGNYTAYKIHVDSMVENGDKVSIEFTVESMGKISMEVDPKSAKIVHKSEELLLIISEKTYLIISK